MMPQPFSRTFERRTARQRSASTAHASSVFDKGRAIMMTVTQLVETMCQTASR